MAPGSCSDAALGGVTLTPLAQHVWQTRYRASDNGAVERSIADTWSRVARTAASIEADTAHWQTQFRVLLEDFKFLPGGRILAGAGTTRAVTLANCFVMGMIQDSIVGIFEALKEGAITLQQGGGVGYDFSTLRPGGFGARSSGTVASGPVSFIAVFDRMCATMEVGGARHGAMMATLRCDHPDIEAFIAAKSDARELTHCNLAVLVSDEFMRAVRRDAPWPLVFPLPDTQKSSPVDGMVRRVWSGQPNPVACYVVKQVRAAALWQSLCQRAHAYAEPGVLFIDRINAANNLGYCEQLSATNPCAEAPLPPYGACLLGSLNLTAFVRAPFSANAHLDEQALGTCARTAVRFLDNLIDISRYPMFRQAQAARASRRLGLGITGLADALAMLRLRYDCDAARALARRALTTIRDAAYAASIELARERGSFTCLNRSLHVQQPFIRSLPSDLQVGVTRYGIRNSHLLAIAPAGSISLLAGNVSSGIEPIVALEMRRRVTDSQGGMHDFVARDYAYDLWRQGVAADGPLPEWFVLSAQVAAHDQLAMQGVLQIVVDGGISKTITFDPHATAVQVEEAFGMAYDLGLKGCAVFRLGSREAVIRDCRPAPSY